MSEWNVPGAGGRGPPAPGTFHCSGIDELLKEAFTRFADQIVTVFEHHLGRAETPEQVREAVTDLVHALSEGPRRDLVLAHELYTLAARRAEYRELTQAWMRRSRVLLEQHFDPVTARQLDALIEGLALHRSLDGEPHSRELTRLAVARLTAVPS
ncbi:TetR family transcriptional regulator [Streptomyces luteogriseus]|uniref:TetR/AcrR family transcriptional regulator n=1 Tax=Streptomyces luteogriseus TaxID=68233 RepID=UPI00340E4F4D